MIRVVSTYPFERELPPAAAGAVAIVRVLAATGHQALLAGGCVRDLLLGRTPEDYDVATDAPPERVGELFKATRKVGAQFGVVLVRQRGRWIEVATFRTDGPYLDGRRPAQVTLSDARHDAERRDFTVNGMFLDPLAGQVIDYVGGRPDLEARVIRAIGEPAARFDEDYLRLLRAVRFAAKLDFALEPLTLAAIRTHAPQLANVAAERVREELERMFADASRLRAWRLLADCGLLAHLWPRASWEPRQVTALELMLGRLPPAAPFELALAVLLAEHPPAEIQRIARDLTLSNEQREVAAWLVAHQRDLDEPGRPSLAELKRLMAHAGFDALRMLAPARFASMPDGARRLEALEARLRSIPPEAVQPPPLVTGEDLLARGVAPGPVYREVLEVLYVRQLNEELTGREAALAALEGDLRARGCDTRNG